MSYKIKKYQCCLEDEEDYKTHNIIEILLEAFSNNISSKQSAKKLIIIRLI